MNVRSPWVQHQLFFYSDPSAIYTVLLHDLCSFHLAAYMDIFKMQLLNLLFTSFVTFSAALALPDPAPRPQATTASGAMCFDAGDCILSVRASSRSWLLIESLLLPQYLHV